MSIMRCKTSFMTNVNGSRRMIRQGDLFSSDDPVVKGREALFDAVEDVVAKRTPKSESVVERATAEPGERRSVGRPRKPEGLTPENAPKTVAAAKAAGVKIDEPKHAAEE